LRVIGEHDAAQRGAVQVPVGRKDLGAPPGHDLAIRSGANFHGPAGQDVGVNDRGATLREHLSDRRFAAADVAGESYQEHDGFLETGPVAGAAGAVQAYERLRDQSTTRLERNEQWEMG